MDNKTFGQHYRWINYPKDINPELKARYEALADMLEANAAEPIAIVWAAPDEDWTDDNGVNPERNCLLVTQHTQYIDGRYQCETFGLNLSTHRLY